MGGSFKEGGRLRPMHEKKQELSWKHMVKPSSPQKGTGVFAKGLNPVRRVSHRGSVRSTSGRAPSVWGYFCAGNFCAGYFWADYVWMGCFWVDYVFADYFCADYFCADYFCAGYFGAGYFCAGCF